MEREMLARTLGSAVLRSAAPITLLLVGSAPGRACSSHRPDRTRSHRDRVTATGWVPPTAGSSTSAPLAGFFGSRLPSLVCRRSTCSVHDSLHTRRTMRFELRTVWPVTHGGALALVDDVDNQFFRDFVREVSEPSSIVTRPADGTYMFGAMRKARPADHSGGLSAAASPWRIVSPPGRSTKTGSLPPIRPHQG